MSGKATSGPQRLKGLVERFPSARILVVGDVMVDRYYWGRVRRVSPEAPVPVVEVSEETRRLGGAANVANNIKSLGGNPVLCGMIGRDRDGEWFLEELDRRGIDGAGIAPADGLPTTVKSRVVAHSQQVLRFDREKRDFRSSALAECVEGFLKKIWKGVDAVVISDYGKGVVSDSLMDRVRSLNRKEAKIPVVADPKSNSFERYRRCAVITPNLKEALSAASLDGEDERDVARAGNSLLRRTGGGAVLITRGEEGMSLFEKGREPFHIPTVAREVYDVTGAGDTVVGTLSLALAAGAGMREAAFLANLAAGIVVGEFGTVPVTRKELLSGIPRRLPVEVGV